MFGDVHSLHSATATIFLAFQPEEIVVENARSHRQSRVRACFIVKSMTNLTSANLLQNHLLALHVSHLNARSHRFSTPPAASTMKKLSS